MKTINTNSSIGFSSLTKRIGGDAPAAAPAARTGSAFSNDALVRTGAPTAPAGSAAAAGTAAMDRLASAYDSDPSKFARNLAEQALNDVVSLVG